MTTDYTVRIKKYDRVDPRLGRNVRHDSRSLMYQVEAQDLGSLQSIRHPRFIPTLDQGNLGSCTGNAGTSCLGTGVFWDTTPNVKSLLSIQDGLADERYAVELYSEATELDAYDGIYPPTDTGSDGLSIAKVLQRRGLISGYQHATSLEACLTALSYQPVLIGTEWRSGMYNPDPDGRLRISGQVQGGHEYILDELDVHHKRVWMHNSWSDGWGVQGRAFLTWDDLGELLAAQGDVTVLTPFTAPAPQPTPEPEPVPIPQPEPPQPTPIDPELAVFAGAASAFNQQVQQFLSWLQSKQP